MLPAIAAADTEKHMGNTVRVLTSGSMGPAAKPQWAEDKWYFLKRTKWWNDYQHYKDYTPMVYQHEPSPKK